jgi:hypothetical protein
MQNKQFEFVHYSDSLLEEYQNARGYTGINPNNPVIMEDIEKFIKERKRSNDLYGELLDCLMLDCRDCDTIENINAKEFLISRTCDYDTTVATSDRKIYDDVRRDRVMIGNIKVFDGIPELVTKKDGTMVFTSLDSFKTIMVTNPRVKAMRYFSEIFKVGKYNLIMGINGMDHDYDRKQKVNTMNKIADTFGNSIIARSIYDPSTDDYAYVIATRNFRK